ncbi:hypothetical protein AYR54_12055 (plasmid) [Loigolactobacillus backii]|nr:hypothetical protein AYR54_12055 [Loigolactobacillus backii]
MGTWNNLQEGFTVNERLPDTLVDVTVWHVFNRASQLYRQAPQINGSRIFGVGKYFHSKSTRPFLITKKGI